MLFKKNIEKDSDISEILHNYDTSKLSIFDENKRYSLVKYNDIIEENLGDVRGWIIDKVEKKIVCKSFPHTPIQIFNGDNNMLNHNEYQIALEGTIIRVWTGYEENDEFAKTLYFSTHSRINCSNSKWNSKKTFLQMFNEAIEEMKFDKSKLMDGNIHILMLVHQENQLTNLFNLQHPIIYHLDSLKSDTFENIECDFGLSKVQPINKEQAFDFLINGGHGVVSTGIENKVKIISPMYNGALEIVGGKNLFQRYVELMRTHEQGKLIYVVPRNRIEEIKSFERRFNDMIYEALPHIVKLFIHWKKTGEKIDVRYHKFFITIRNNKNPNINTVIKGALYRYDPVEVKKICRRIMKETI